MNACPFCNADGAVLGNALAFARLDINPVTEGHLLAVPRRHVANWFDASAQERAALFALINEGKHWLETRRVPDGYNIGINVGVAAGQTIMHLHVHLIPRYRGDTANPRGGVRSVIPSKQWYPSEGDAT